MKTKSAKGALTLLTIIFIFCLFFTAGIGKTFAQQYNSSRDFEYDWDKNVKDGVVITKYVGSSNEVRIPTTIENFRIITIGNSAFWSNRNITSVTIPASVTSIGDLAFSNCTSLTSITIGSGLKSIGNSAFQGCTKLTSITIPNSVTDIGNQAFQGCTSLTSATIGSGVTSIGNSAFVGCTSLASVTIPRSVTSIGFSAFEDCTNLLSVTFQGTIPSRNFGTGGAMNTRGFPATMFPGNLAEAYLDNRNGGPGTYTRFANGQEWRRR